MNRMEVKSLMNMIIPYSAIKIIANNPPPYSTLNPETSSLSLSAWSNGVRLLSLRQISIHIMKAGNLISMNLKFSWDLKNCDHEKEFCV